ncbi:MAG TPA: hypothetical protein VF756_27750 [Thermoanaerobaculia bacterium]
MARVRRYMNRTNGWEQAISAVIANLADLAHLDGTRAQLQDLLEQARSLSSQQAAATAAKQEATRALQQVLQKGEALVDVLRTGARAHYGNRSEKLVEFGMQPFRGRNRSAETEPPVEPSPEPGERQV